MKSIGLFVAMFSILPQLWRKDFSFWLNCLVWRQRETDRERLMSEREPCYLPCLWCQHQILYLTCLTEQQRCCRDTYPTRNKGTARRNKQSASDWDEIASLLHKEREHVAFYKWENHRRFKGVSQTKDLGGTLRVLTPLSKTWISKRHWNHTPCSVLFVLKCRNEFTLF